MSRYFYAISGQDMMMRRPSNSAVSSDWCCLPGEPYGVAVI